MEPVTLIYHSPRKVNMADAWGIGGERERWVFIRPDGKEVNVEVSYTRPYTRVWITNHQNDPDFFWEDVFGVAEILIVSEALAKAGYEQIQTRQPLLDIWELTFGHKQKVYNDDW